jgi:hypothetical protein
MSEDKVIQERFKQLPEIVQKAIVDSDWRNKIANIAHKYSLNLEQATNVEYITLYTMFGVLHPKDFLDNLVRDGEIESGKAILVSKEVDEQIFRNIKKDLLELIEREEAGENVFVEHKEETKQTKPLEHQNENLITGEILSPDLEKEREEVLKIIEEDENVNKEDQKPKEEIAQIIQKEIVPENNQINEIQKDVSSLTEPISSKKPSESNTTNQENKPIKQGYSSVDPYRETII